MNEYVIERGVFRIVKQLGGHAYKWTSPGTAGVPDRICILPKGRVIFVETKRPDLEDGRSVRQRKVISTLEKLGCTVWKINDLTDFKERLRGLGYEI